MERLELSVARTRRTFTWLAATHAALVLATVIAVIFFTRPTALVLGAPSMVILLSTAAGVQLSRPAVAAWIDRPRALEGDSLTISVALRSHTHVPLADIEYQPQPPLVANGASRALYSVAAEQEPVAEFVVSIDEWGVVQLGQIKVTARDRFGLSAIITLYRIMTPVRVHIHEEAGRSLTDPDRFLRLVGSHQSAERGEGCEIADVRPYQPGDRLQALNWRISARNDEPWITLRHPDRSTTIVLLLDGYQRFGQQRSDALRRSVRCVLGLARLHIGAQDPVGMMIVGQGLRWVPPELGRMHMHRLTDVLLELSTNRWSERPHSQTMTERLIPKDAVVLAISPLADGRFVKLISSLRARGQSLHVIQPVTYWPAHAEAHESGRKLRSAWRIFSLRMQLDRRRLSEAGIPVIPWEEDQPIESVLLALRMSRRARQAVVRG